MMNGTILLEPRRSKTCKRLTKRNNNVLIKKQFNIYILTTLSVSFESSIHLQYTIQGNITMMISKQQQQRLFLLCSVASSVIGVQLQITSNADEGFGVDLLAPPIIDPGCRVDPVERPVVDKGFGQEPIEQPMLDPGTIIFSFHSVIYFGSMTMGHLSSPCRIFWFVHR